MSDTVTRTVSFSIYGVQIGDDGKVICLCDVTFDGGATSEEGWMYISTIHDGCVQRATDTGTTLQEAVDELNHHIATGGKDVP